MIMADDATDTLSRCDPAVVATPSEPGELVLLADQGSLGGPCYEYRGAAIHASKGCTTYRFYHGSLPGCEEGHWLVATSAVQAMHTIDAWLDTGRLPAPYVDQGSGEAG